MSKQFNDRALKSMALAETEARAMGHGYVGTEHLLLGLIQVGFDSVPHLLTTFGLSVDRLRAEVEKLVQRDARPSDTSTLPLTPRAQRAIEYAKAEASLMKLTSIQPEHLLLGLCREPDGVAGQALRNLGVRLDELRSEVFRIRLKHVKIVERAVRSVRAGTAWKRKTREELLAHLTAIYDEELEQLNDPDAAFKAAAERFGDPAELAQELAASLPADERRRYLVERFFGWRAPETAVKYLLRQMVTMYAALAICCAIVALVIFPLDGLRIDVAKNARPALAMLLFLPPIQFALGWLYFKMRDAMYAPPWAKRSATRVLIYNLLTGGVAFAATLGYLAVATWDWDRALDSVDVAAGMAAAASIGHFLLARHRGSTEIADTLWACLNLDAAAAS